MILYLILPSLSLSARLSSSDSGKCTEHDVESCSKCTKEVSLDELTALLEGGLRLVDVREAYELRDAGRIPNAVNIPCMYHCHTISD